MTYQSQSQDFPETIPEGRPAVALEAALAWAGARRASVATVSATAAEASRWLAEIVEQAVLSAIAWAPDPAAQDTTAPGVGIGASAGLGKTEACLKALVRHGRTLLPKGHVVLFFPTLDLAQEAYRRFEELQSGLPAFVMRGRLAADPYHPGERMCARAEIVKKAQGLLPSIGEGFCRRKKADGTMLEAPCFAGCRYYGQFDGRPHSIIFASHGYLSVHLPVPDPVALRIIDESFWKSLCRISRIGLDTWLAGPTPRPIQTCLHRIEGARRAVFAARRDGAPLCASLRALGVDVDQLTAFADFEMDAVDALKLRPGLSEDEQSDRLARFDHAAWHNARRRAGVWRLLAETLHLDDTERLVFDPAASSDTGEARPTFFRHSLRPLALNVPTIVIDADLDPLILDACLPGLDIHRIDVALQAEVVQLVDRTLSNGFLLAHKHADRHRGMVLDIIEDEVRRANGGGVLAVAASKVLKALHDDERTAGPGDQRLLQPLRGATPRWFGDNLRGVDSYKHFSTVVIVGRLEQSPATIEQYARCLFADGPVPLVVGDPAETADEAMEIAAGHFEVRRIHSVGGDPVLVRTRTHRDPRCQAVEVQLREAATSQAIARLRLVHPAQPKRVLVLSSVPIPGLTVTQLVSWRQLCHPRLQAAFEETGRRGLRLSANGLADDAPATFRSPEAAAAWIRRLGGRAALIAAVEGVVRPRALQFGSIRLEGSRGRPTPVALVCDPGEDEAVARSLWPGLTSLKRT